LDEYETDAVVSVSAPRHHHGSSAFTGTGNQTVQRNRAEGERLEIELDGFA
jgi:hypothetical protein